MRTQSLFACLCAVSTASGQISITAADLPQADEAWAICIDVDTNLQISAPGPGQIWDWTGVFNITDTVVLEWVEPGPLPGAAGFPDANLGHGQESGSFYKTDATGFHYLGDHYSSTNGSNIEHVDDDFFQPSPFAFGNTVSTDRVATRIIVNSDAPPALKSVERRTDQITADAWGTMSTPAFPAGVQVLRLRFQFGTTLDSLFYDTTGTGNGPWGFNSLSFRPAYEYYQYVRNGHPYVVATHSADAQYKAYYLPSLTIGVPEPALVLRAPLAWPVPSMDGLVHISTGGAGRRTIEVMDTQGIVVRRFSTWQDDPVGMDTAGLAAGTYQFRCLDAEGRATGQGRFIVAR